ncbi:folylpolyglutamate synthase/dihydrofolate synthase family protein [uncultured Sphingorhabdus sp.]|uniref:bifunctional folylpolyglutamate synthase/dihydrofolate synthase n=1 Tax=uncultured Sphingorhabdus sp. TaxID=1686106 RepID=UPI0026233E1C|nr:folylpolyglutamate synthase/dihydrofolate synthase family protein [uncultured Sphingorhabdus sp.]HMS19381.1 folylpolyglutamate synthase/dihydrofolate synthase family protein [Sphingorhabdus sp.]
MADHAKSDHPAVQAQLDRLTALSPGRDTLGLERISALCERLGNPQDHLPPVFHVAGTNGKGSTCAFLRGAIEAAGLECHVYSSPHLVRFNERIRVAGKLIEDEVLAALLSEVLDHAEGLQASFFEVTTAAAFLAFSRTDADACVIEVGLGGRLDATNVIKKPAVCGIASLAIDHEAFLLAPEEGVPEMEPLDRIAFEKSGIAKANVPLVTQAYSPSMQRTIIEQTNRTGAIPTIRKRDWDAEIRDSQLHYHDGQEHVWLPRPSMAGRHQADNAALAIAMIMHQPRLSIPREAMKSAMLTTRWPARMQRLAAGPLTDLLPTGTELWLDGGHNVDGGLAIAAHFATENRQIHLVTGMLANKNPASIIAPLSGKLASVTVLPVPGHDHHGVEAFGPEAKAAPDIQTALQSLSVDPERQIVLIAGTLYLAGSVLKANGEEPV